TAHGSVPVRAGAMLRLITDDGLEGLGEASPVPAFGGGTLDDALKLLSEFAPGLIGCDLAQAEARLAKLDFTLPAAAAVGCALDTALCDLRARAAGLSLAMLLGAANSSVMVNATIGAPESAAAVLAARRAAEAGFR